MLSAVNNPSLPWLAPGQSFPPVAQAWGAGSAAPGLLCAGADLSVSSLRRAYQSGTFPWFSAGQPILWWAPDPRMVLAPADFCLHPSLRKTVRKFMRSAQCEIRIDSAYESVIQGCANIRRDGQDGTWIVPDMVDAYIALHRAGFAHSIETWVDNQLVGGLYFVAIGRAVFGESMFHRVSDGSKIALVALVCLCNKFNISQIDCQQNTRHLASLGAREVPRQVFIQVVASLSQQPQPAWQFSAADWHQMAALTCAGAMHTPKNEAL